MSSKKKTLVIVDMQPAFEAANDSTVITEVVKLTKEFLYNGMPIILLEYADQGDTHSEIRSLVQEAEFHKIVQKEADGGHYHVAAVVQDWHGFSGIYNPESFEFDICGVNLDACVKDTAIGLKKLGFKVNIRKNACNQPVWAGPPDRIHKHFVANGVEVL